MRKLAVVMAVALASGRADALGLGDIELYSALNEPLNAEVRLLAEQPGELANAVVRLAPNEEFTRAGIERPGILSDINFAINRRNDGTAVLKITSTQPIREPFLDFIVQLSWQSGRLLREYTVLLDPPVFGEEKTAPVSTPLTAQMESPAPRPAAKPETAPPAPVEAAPVVTAPPPAAPAPKAMTRQKAAPAPAADAASGADGERSYGPTRPNETLWNVASGLRPDNSVSVYQMMMALLKDNPRAFYDNNVNNLKAGYVLRVPEKSVVAGMDHREAVREAARQYERWQQAKRGIAAAEAGTVPPAAEPAQAAQPSAGATEKDAARLRLVAPADTAAGSSAGAQAQLEKLRGELAIALESSDAAKRDSDELRSRVAALEQQINSLQRLLTLKDEALSEMQKRSGVQVPESAKTPAPALELPPAVPAKPAPAKPAPAKPAPKAAEEPALDVFANPTLMGAVAGAGLLLLSVLWLVMRRRRGGDGGAEHKDAGDEPSSFLTGLMAKFRKRGGAEEPAPMPTVAADEPPAVNFQFAPEEPEPEEEVFDARMTQVAEEAAQHAESGMAETASGLEVMPPSSEGEIDPIVEADVYLAYRRYQQAEALVQGALAKQPHRQDLQAKLLEIYYAAKNPDAFQALALSFYENLGGDVDDPQWQRILPMGRELCPDHELFKVSDPHMASGGDSFADEVSGRPAAEEGHGFLGEAVAGSAAGGYETNASPSEEAMDFDLNLEGQAGEAPTPSQESPASLSAALDFDGIPAEDGNKAAGAEQVDVAAGDKAQKSWAIEPAMSEFGNIDFGLDDSDLLAGTDVVGTKLDLARAYIDMGDNESASDILKEVLNEGNDQQKQEAKSLMEKTG